jgi:hypothetical protein
VSFEVQFNIVGPWGDQPGASPGYGLILVTVTGGHHPPLCRLTNGYNLSGIRPPLYPIPGLAPQLADHRSFGAA